MSLKIAIIFVLLAISCVFTKIIKPVSIEKEEALFGTCEACQFIVGFVEGEVIGDNRQQIELFIEDVCNLIPSSIRPQCRSIVGTYSDELITYVLNKVTPTAACQGIKLCSKSEGLYLSKLATNMKPLIPAKPLDQSLCQDCQTAVFFAKLYLQSNSTITQIQQLIKAGCQDLFPNNYAQCVLFGNMGVQYVISFINSNSAQQICADIKFCTSVQRWLRSMQNQPSTCCSVCELAAQLLENELVSLPVENAIQDALNSVCTSVFPQGWVSECQLLVEGLVPQLLAELIKNYPASTLCTTAGFCN